MKKKDQVYMQTWHGFALKKLEQDVEASLEPEYLKACKTDSEQCDVIVSGSGVSDQRKSSGTGRGASATTVTARSVRSSRSSTKKETSPRVALISTNWQRNGDCV